MAADLYGIDAADVVIESGVVHVNGQAQPIVDLVQASLGRLRGKIIGNGTMRKTDMPEHPLGGEPAFYEFNCSRRRVMSAIRDPGSHFTAAFAVAFANPALVASR